MRRILPILPFVLILAACSPTTVPLTDEGVASSPISSEAPSVRETPNVSYQGIVAPVGMSIYMQGTHQLQLSDGRRILLESSDIDLDRSINHKVGVFGATRPTVEGQGIIMRVEEVILLEEVEESSSSAMEEEVSSADASLEADASSVPMESSVPASKAAASVAAKPVTPPPAVASSAAQQPPADEGSIDATINERATLMAKDKMDGAFWTQKYCTSHIGFCVPIHKNWWFKSFGTTSSSLWHVEVSNSEIENLGEGPIILKLLSGNVSSRNAADGGVRVEGSWVTGFKAWGANEHFEITAPAKLQAAVAYMTAHLTAQEGQ